MYSGDVNCYLLIVNDWLLMLVVFVLEDALSIQRDNASSQLLYLRRFIRLDELGQTLILLLVWFCISSIKMGTRLIICLHKLSFKICLDICTWDILSTCIIHLMPIFILETHNSTNYKSLPKSVQIICLQYKKSHYWRGWHLIVETSFPKICEVGSSFLRWIPTLM